MPNNWVLGALILVLVVRGLEGCNYGIWTLRVRQEAISLSMVGSRFMVCRVDVNQVQETHHTLNLKVMIESHLK